MAKLHRTLAIFIFFISFVLSFLLGIHMTESAASGFLTAFAIITGFYITSITVIINSTSVGRLYRTEDKDLPGQTLLQTYKKYFSNSFYWSITATVLMILYLLDFDIKIPNYLTLIIDPILISVSAVNIFWSVVIFQTIMAIMLYEGKDKK